ncbi:molybdopterin molybdotransferase MoeA [Marinimicrobium sp. ARAG 43.8]|uniref:molybdopterin molybdotransferase MoeA n=1 Tax=Marinimicrobium sp. ARAG 43.8 TaxID=3418719 RepID=UPI003CED9CF7
MTHCDAPGLIPLADALARMQMTVQTVEAIETVPLSELLDRVLAEPVHATINVPGYDNSAMDGYALRAVDAGLSLTIAGQALAGHTHSEPLKPGECVRITTGAPIPPGADTVVMQEDTERVGERLRLTITPNRGDHIRRAGESIAEGTEVLPAGYRLGPIDIGLLASLGLAQARVRRKPVVAVLSTGDELTPPGAPLAEGQLYDSNRYSMIAVLRRLNVEVLDLGLIPDQPEAIREAFRRAAHDADAVLSSGGVSVGDADHVRPVLEELGEIGFWKVAIKPGKPFAFGQLGQAVFFGLPGNPVSSLVTLHQLAVPVLRTIAGEAPPPPVEVAASATDTFHKRPGRLDFQRAVLRREGEENRVSGFNAQGSGILTSFLGANAYAVLEADRGAVSPGDTVTVLPFDRFIT